jgi:hypothetical protein
MFLDAVAEIVEHLALSEDSLLNRAIARRNNPLTKR